MPVIRSKGVASSKKPIAPALVALEDVLKSLPSDAKLSTTPKDFSCVDNIFYPKGDVQRESFRTKGGKRVTAHQWAVYDLVRKIPVGNVSTYKDVCAALGKGSPRSVGSALRDNPFAPYVPCHRIIASNRFIGGFFGEWGGEQSKRATKAAVSHCDWKIKMLALEGVEFDEKGYLVSPENVLWKA